MDRSILRELQLDGRITTRELADKVSLSNAPCWRRLKRLEQESVITGYTAIIDAQKIGLTTVAFAEVSLDNHHPDTVEKFLQKIQNCSQILECHAVSGGCDYLLKVLAEDMESYQAFLMSSLLSDSGVRNVNTLFSMKQQKVTYQLPI